MPDRHRTVALVCVGVYVVFGVVLAIAAFVDGAWVRGAIWAVSAALFAGAYAPSLARRCRV